VHSIARYLEHLVWATIKGFVVGGVLAAVVCFGALYVAAPNHSLTAGLSTTFAGVIVLLTALLGAAVALIYRLSHIGELSHAVKHLTTNGTSGS